MFFNKIFTFRYEMYSPFHKKEIIDKLSDLKTNYTGTLNSKEKLFEGSIYNNSAVLYPIFDYKSRQQLRPKINLFIDEKNVIHLKYEIPKIYKTLLIFCLVLCFVASFGVYYVYKENILDIPFFIVFIPFIVYLITVFNFKSFIYQKIIKSNSLFLKKFNAEYRTPQTQKTRQKHK